MIETDILIIGGGPAGATAALFLAKAGIASTLVDKALFPRDKICGDAISGKAFHVLNKLYPQFSNELKQDSHVVGSWGVSFVAPNGEALRIPFRTKKEMNTAPGVISTRLFFDNWLMTKVKSENWCRVHEQTEIRSYSREGNVILAESTTGQVFKTKMVIAGDGASSTFSKDMAGLATEPNHNCFGLRAYYRNVTGLDHQNFIELHFLKELLPGYFWIFPLPGGYVNTGIGMRADKMKAKKVNLKRAFESVLESNPTMRKRFAAAERVSDIKLHGLPLGSKKRRLSGDNYLLCGDAAQLIDPFTGEGIGNAMMSGMLAAQQAQLCLQRSDFSAFFTQQYDKELYHKLWSELKLSYRMQQLVSFPSLFNLVVRKANSNRVLSETISCMFEDLDIRARLKSPRFYFKLLFSKKSRS